MSHLAEVYAKDLGVKIGTPVFLPHFYPIVEENYITIHTDNKVDSKHYDYWEEVINIVKTKYEDVKFIQIGSGKEPKIKNVYKFIETKSIKQSAFLIKNALMHVGIDSCPVHIASHLDTPIVAIYGHTYAKTCDPLWGSKEKQTIIESDRNGNKPSFSLKEFPKTINMIKPEVIANSILEKLGKEKSERKTLFIGDRYKEQLVHVIPDKKYSLSKANIVLRLDLLHNEENCLHFFNNNKISIMTKKPVSDEILKSKNINNISYFADKFDEDFVKRVKKHGVALRLICTKKKYLSDQRVKFIDDLILLIEEHKKISNNKKRVSLKKNKFKAKSCSVYLKNGEAYGSLYAANGEENLNDIFVDLDSLMIYKESHEQG